MAMYVHVVIPMGHHIWRHTSDEGCVDGIGGWTTVPVCYLCGDQGGEAWHLPPTTTSLGGMVQRGLNGRLRMMNT
jgi:hypothetical protein